MEPLQKILSASTELFIQYGFKTITMDDIARRAGISKKTLYQFYANKPEVVKESFIWYKEHMSDNIAELVKEAENALEAMVKMLAYLDEMHKKINPNALFELQRFYPETYELFRSMLIERDLVMIKEIITQGELEGLYRQGLNTEILARYRLETSLMILQPNLIVNDRFNFMRVHLAIGEHFLFGIMTEKGIQLYEKYKNKYLKHITEI